MEKIATDPKTADSTIGRRYRVHTPTHNKIVGNILRMKERHQIICDLLKLHLIKLNDAGYVADSNSDAVCKKIIKLAYNNDITPLQASLLLMYKLLDRREKARQKRERSNTMTTAINTMIECCIWTPPYGDVARNHIRCKSYIEKGDCPFEEAFDAIERDIDKIIQQAKLKNMRQQELNRVINDQVITKRWTQAEADFAKLNYTYNAYVEYGSYSINTCIQCMNNTIITNKVTLARKQQLLDKQNSGRV
jgi:hypothetical protein